MIPTDTKKGAFLDLSRHRGADEHCRLCVLPAILRENDLREVRAGCIEQLTDIVG